MAGLVPTPQDKVVFMDVGQGDAILLERGTRQVLIDGGPDRKILERLSEEMPFFDRKIEVVMLTHPDTDHLAGLLEVLNKYEIGLVLLPKVADATQLQEEWLNLLLAKNVLYRFAERGQVIEMAGLTINILNPTREMPVMAGKRLNDYSVATKVYMDEISFLLPGDLEQTRESWLVNNERGGELAAQVLKAGHHGSKSSTSQQWLDRINPRVAVVSAGKDNRYNHPSPETLERLEGRVVLRTDQSGSVRFVKEGGRWLVGCGGKEWTKMASSCTNI